MRRPRVQRCVRLSVLARWRCRMGSVGCGFWSGWRAAADATRSRWRFGFAARWVWGRWELRLGVLLSGTGAWARSSLSGVGVGGRRFWLLERRAFGFRYVG